jgi:hypothetical protein
VLQESASEEVQNGEGRIISEPSLHVSRESTGFFTKLLKSESELGSLFAVL